MDDECIVLVSKSARQLEAAIPKALNALVESFSALDLEINWSKGKTEALVRFRGSGAQQVFASHCHDGQLSFEVPGSSSRLLVVDHYKHLGTNLSLDSACMADARHKEQSTLAAYSPLAVQIFASPVIHDWVKLHLMFSL